MQVHGLGITEGGQVFRCDALLRRIGYGLEAAREHPDAPILCSGGGLRVGPSEASLMAELLCRDGIGDERLILDEASRNTLENCAAAAAEAARGGHPYVVACSDGYHLPRIRTLKECTNELLSTGKS